MPISYSRLYLRLRWKAYKGVNMFEKLQGLGIDERNFFQILLLIFSIVSYCATAYGMYGLYADTAAINSTLALTIAAFFTLGIQALMFKAVLSMRHQETVGKRCLYLCLYSICAFISISFACAFWFQAMEAENYARLKFQEVSQRIVQDFNALDAGINSYIQNMETLKTVLRGFLWS